jgi:diguanylate cyclase (GGDEF)-like protein/PAS domain S-box-containing protein
MLMRGGVARIVAIYAAFSAMWILLSDRAVSSLVDDPDRITAISMWKGWLFVAVTSGLLYLLMRRVLGEQARAVAQLRASEADLRTLTEQVPAIIYRARADGSGDTLYVSPQVTSLGYTPEQWLADPTARRRAIHPDDRDRVVGELAQGVRSGGGLTTEYRIASRSGRWVTVLDEARLIQPVEGGPAYLQGLMVDVTAQRKAEDDLRHLSLHDSLTGLPNRALLLDRLGDALALSRWRGGAGCLLVLGIDRLHLVNEARGHDIGDRVLREVGERLVEAVGADDTVARLEGDEFAVLLHALGQPPQAARGSANLVAHQVHSALSLPFRSGSDELAITASLGVAVFDGSSLEQPEDVLRRADTAMDRAKAAGGSQTAFFADVMGEAAQLRFEVEASLRRGIARGELRTHLQAQVDANALVVGAEALVRWEHPEQGLLLPGGFIPFAEESDLIIDVDTWVLRAVCELLARPEVARRSLRLSANVSPRTFRQPTFAATVRTILAETGADPACLTMEVTEGLMIGDLAEVIACMTEIAELGVHLSVDDFGTRYSSLAYLRRMPIRELKIDRSFVQDAPTDPDDAMLVQVMLAVAAHMGLRVVAEGVETPEQAAFLNARADVLHQGYLYGRPEPVESWLAGLAGAARGSVADGALRR